MQDDRDIFTTYALNTAPRPVAKRIQRRLDKPTYVPATAAERKQREDEELAARYRRLIRGEEEWLLASPCGAATRQLVDFLDHAGLDDADGFNVRLRSAETLLAAPKEFRIIALRMIDRAIQRLRERNGLTFCDDPIDPEEPTMMQEMRRILEI